MTLIIFRNIPFAGQLAVSKADGPNPGTDKPVSIPLNDMQLADRLDLNERTVRKWRSGETKVVFTT